MNKVCPVCQAAIMPVAIYAKERCPVLNNVVYKSIDEAKSCQTGKIKLAYCSKCCFVYNLCYNLELLTYGQDYNSNRCFSPYYVNYLDALVKHCSIDLKKEHKILEIGCGDGSFLKRLCSHAGVKGVGYDASYKGNMLYNEQIKFVPQVFIPAQENQIFDVIFLRHILEHIPQPYDFLDDICQSSAVVRGTKLWIEVPDFNWIVKNGVYYDITYEHCNYFTRSSMHFLLTQLGFEVVSQTNIFGEQYLLVEAIYTQKKCINSDISKRLLSTSNLEQALQKNKQRFEQLVRENDDVCVWGASGKGVIFLSELEDKLLSKIKYVVDINQEKQGQFLPLSGKKIVSPERLKDINTKLTLLIMNEIYYHEIEMKLQEMNINAEMFVL